MKNFLDFERMKTDSTYKARMMLLVYGLFFVVLIAMIRFNGPADKKTTLKKDDDSEIVDNIDKDDDDKDKDKDKDEFKEFASIRGKNFYFTYRYTLNDVVYESIGKKYNDKEEFSLTAVGEKFEFRVNGSDMYVVNNKTGEKFEGASKPYKHINYFNVVTIENILKVSTYDEDNDVYNISSEDLRKTLGYDNYSIDDNGNNEIKVTFKNNIITSISIDYSNFIKALEKDYTVAKLYLEYKDFNLVDDFEVKME